MSAAKHTQGEWSVLEHEGEVYVLANGAQQIAAVTYVIEHAGEQGSRRLQNARMMAAAPELVEALAGLMELERRDRFMPIGREWDAARAAIAKATGSAS